MIDIEPIEKEGWVLARGITAIGNGECTYQVKHFYDISTVDAAPVVHGKWEWLSSTYDRSPCEARYRCSKCYHETITHGHRPWENYCPNCGALMDGKQEARDTDV